ncbi:MAG: hypothetical protein ABI824_00200 [Acidobacteriota bacterium]
MPWNQIASQWRRALVIKLQDQYGLAEPEAKKRADQWLQWVKKEAKKPLPARCLPAEPARKLRVPSNVRLDASA